MCSCLCTVLAVSVCTSKKNIGIGCVKIPKFVISSFRHIFSIDMPTTLNPINSNNTMNTGPWEGLQISLAAIAHHLSESLTKIQLPWQIYPVPEFINQMPKLKYVWHHPDKDPRNLAMEERPPATMFGEIIGDKESLRRECSQVYINEGYNSQIACCTNKPSQRFWDVEYSAIDFFPEKSQSSQRDDRNDVGPI